MSKVNKSTLETEQIDRVIFRRWPKSEGGGVIALLPDQPANPYRVLAYEHTGQHGEASTDIPWRTKRTYETDPDVIALKKELESAPYEYKFRVVRRLTSVNNKPDGDAR
jgi:hypothetical protein